MSVQEQERTIRHAVPREPKRVIIRDILACVRDALIIAFFVAAMIFGASIINAVSNAGSDLGDTSFELPQPSETAPPFAPGECIGEEPC